MKEVSIGIHVIPSRVNTTLIEGCDVCKIGKTHSTTNKINVNKIGTDAYTILYTGDAFKGLDMPVLGRNIINVLMKNLKNSDIKISIFYHYEYINDDETDEFSEPIGLRIISLHMYFDKLFHNRSAVTGGNVIQYIGSESVLETVENIRDLYSSDYDEEDSNDNDNDDTDEDDEEIDAAEALSEILNDTGYKDKKKKKSYKKKDYGSSRVFRAAKSPKRAYRRHGVLVCSKKSAIKRDEKILKEFLKDFFPGSAEWKKEFRRDVLKRWMSMYVVTSNKLKQLEKEYRKRMKKKRYKSIDTEKAIDLTRRLLNVPIDTWSDPSK